MPEIEEANPANAERLYIAQGNKFTCYVEDFALDKEMDQVWMLSLLGAQTEVRAIAASMLTHEPSPIALSPLNSDLVPQWKETRYCRIPHETEGSWRMITTRLPVSGATNLLMYTKWAEPRYPASTNFLVITSRDEEAPRRHYNLLDARTSLPMHETWTDWLWDRGLATGEVRELTSMNRRVYLCRPQLTMLQYDVGVAVAAGRLTVPD